MVTAQPSNGNFPLRLSRYKYFLLRPWKPQVANCILSSSEGAGIEGCELSTMRKSIQSGDMQLKRVFQRCCA